MWSLLSDAWQGLYFLHPGWLWAWPPALAGVVLLLWGRRLGALGRLPGPFTGPSYRHPQGEILRRLAQGQAQRQASTGLLRPAIGHGLLLLCLLLALAQPYRHGPQLPPAAESTDTLFLIDTSVSMVLRDYLVEGQRVDRMTLLKSALIHFIERLKGNRIGLIAFSEQPYTLSPLTADAPLLKQMVRRLQPAVLTGRSSHLGRALLYALQKLENGDHASSPHKPQLVLLTDANRAPREIDPRAIAAYLQERGYRLHTVGIGAASYAAQETGNEGLIYLPTNFTLLQSIAEQGGGRFFWADNAASLEAAVQAIQSATRGTWEGEPRYVRLPLYPWPLLVGLLWLMALSWLGDGRRRA